MKDNVHFSSKNNEWSTPQDFFDELNKEFKFDLDPCATPENAKCINYFTKDIDGLKQSWGGVQRVLQSTIRQRDKQMGKESTRGV